MIRFNNGGTGSIEIYFAGTWNTLSSGALTTANGGTGTGTAFTQGSVVFAGASGVYSQNNTSFFWDATNNRLGIGETAPSVSLDLDVNTDAIKLPSGTTAQRPASPASGMWRYNSDSSTPTRKFLAVF